MDSAANARLSSPRFPSYEINSPEKELILGRVVPLAYGARPVLGLAWVHPPGKALCHALRSYAFRAQHYTLLFTYQNIPLAQA